MSDVISQGLLDECVAGVMTPTEALAAIIAECANGTSTTRPDPTDLHGFVIPVGQLVARLVLAAEMDVARIGYALAQVGLKGIGTMLETKLND